MGRERRHMRVVGVEGVVRLSWRGGWLAVEEEEDEEGGGGGRATGGGKGKVAGTGTGAFAGEGAGAATARCSQCAAKAQGDRQLMTCGRCREAFYCSKECQTKHWILHRQQCGPDPLTVAVESGGEERRR